MHWPPMLKLTKHRFTDHELPYEEQKQNLTILMESYLASMADLGAETWIIHGTLLGWWWNRKVNPSASKIRKFILISARYYRGILISMSR